MLNIARLDAKAESALQDLSIAGNYKGAGDGKMRTLVEDAAQATGIARRYLKRVVADISFVTPVSGRLEDNIWIIELSAGFLPPRHFVFRIYADSGALISWWEVDDA